MDDDDEDVDYATTTPGDELGCQWDGFHEAATRRIGEVPLGTLAVTKAGTPTRHVSQWTTTTRTLTTL
jgi:hypothetical protein